MKIGQVERRIWWKGTETSELEEVSNLVVCGWGIESYRETLEIAMLIVKMVEKPVRTRLSWVESVLNLKWPLSSKV